MERFIPISKQSKKAQKEYYAKKRSTWGELNPVTRTVPNGKGYNRKKMKQEERRARNVSHVDMIWSFYICNARQNGVNNSSCEFIISL